jgi:hypothetical protein
MSAVRVKTIGAVYIFPDYFLFSLPVQIGQDESSGVQRFQTELPITTNGFPCSVHFELGRRANSFYSLGSARCAPLDFPMRSVIPSSIIPITVLADENA